MADYAPRDLRASAEASLRRLGIDRIDLLLLHWPPEDAEELQPALEELQRLRSDGVIRELGVSNFPAYMLRDAVEIAPELFADQVEYHAKLSQREILEVAEEKDLLVEAYAPLGGSARDMAEEPGVKGSASDMVEERVLKEIANEHGASPAQVAIAWLAHQERVVVLPRSTNPDRR